MSRTRLLTIINKFHLYAGGKHSLTPDQQVKSMRKDIDVELIRNPNSDVINSFTVTYHGRNPHVVQSVTGELTNLFMNENQSAREQQAAQTTQFIQNQLAAAQAKLASEESKVRAFQAQHQGTLPSEQATNLQLLSGLQVQLQSEESALNNAQQQQAINQSLLTQYRSAAAGGIASTGGSASLTAINNQLSTLQSRLEAMNSRYTPRYPAVIELKQEIAKTQQARRDLIAKLNAAGTTKDANTLTVPSGPMLQVESQLKAGKAEIASRQRSIANLKAQINAYQGRLNTQPQVEQQLTSLMQNYQQAQTNYNDLLKKENESQMVTSMEQSQQGRRFMVLDPPSLPLQPYSPNRIKMWIAGLFAGVVLGLLVVTLVDKLDDRLYTEDEIEKTLSIGILADIPEIVNEEDERRNKMRLFSSWAMASIVCVVMLAGAALSYLHV